MEFDSDEKDSSLLKDINDQVNLETFSQMDSSIFQDNNVLGLD